MERMRSPDITLREGGFDFLREHADSYAGDLIAEFEGAPGDDPLRGWLLELVAESRSELALPVLTAVLQGHDEPLKVWAVRGLEMLDTPAALRELDNARSQGWIL